MKYSTHYVADAKGYRLVPHQGLITVYPNDGSEPRKASFVDSFNEEEINSANIRYFFPDGCQSPQIEVGSFDLKSIFPELSNIGTSKPNGKVVAKIVPVDNNALRSSSRTGKNLNSEDLSRPIAIATPAIHNVVPVGNGVTPGHSANIPSPGGPSTGIPSPGAPSTGISSPGGPSTDISSSGVPSSSSPASGIPSAGGPTGGPTNGGRANIPSSGVSPIGPSSGVSSGSPSTGGPSSGNGHLHYLPPAGSPTNGGHSASVPSLGVPLLGVSSGVPSTGTKSTGTPSTKGTISGGHSASVSSSGGKAIGSHFASVSSSSGPSTTGGRTANVPSPFVTLSGVPLTGPSSKVHSAAVSSTGGHSASVSLSSGPSTTGGLSSAARTLESTNTVKPKLTEGSVKVSPVKPATDPSKNGFKPPSPITPFQKIEGTCSDTCCDDSRPQILMSRASPGSCCRGVSKLVVPIDMEILGRMSTSEIIEVTNETSSKMMLQKLLSLVEKYSL